MLERDPRHRHSSFRPTERANGYTPSRFDLIQSRVGELRTLVETSTQVVKNLRDPSGEPVSEQLMRFITENPHFDRVQVLGIPGSGKTAAALEIDQLLQAIGLKTVINSFDPIYAQLVDYYQAHPKYWTMLQYAYLSYLHSCISFVPAYKQILYDRAAFERHFAEFEYNFAAAIDQLEAHITDRRDTTQPQSPVVRHYPEEFRNFTYAVFSAELIDKHGIDVKELREHITIEELVGAPRGWLRDRGFMSSLLDSARELDRKRNGLSDSRGETIYPTEFSSLTIMMFPDFRNFDFTKAVRKEAVLSSDANLATLKARLRRIGLDVGNGFDNTLESGRRLASIIGDMAPLPVVDQLKAELTDEAAAWAQKEEGSLTRVAKMDAIESVRLNRAMLSHPDAAIMKTCIAYLEYLLFRELKRHSDNCVVAVNPFISGTKVVDLSRMPSRNKS